MNHDGIKKIIEEVEVNYDEIINLISEKYDFSIDKINRISRDSLDAIVYYLYSQIRQNKNDQVQSHNEDFIYGGFFGIESINEDFILLIDLQLYRYISVNKTSLDNPVEGDVYFGVLFPADEKLGFDAYVDRGFVKLDILESSLILDISDNYSDFDPAEVFLNEIAHERIYKFYSTPLINLVFADSEYYMSEFGLIEFSDFFIRLNNITKYLLENPKLDSFVDINLDDFIKNEATKGRFPVEGSIDEFLDILGYILKSNLNEHGELRKLIEQINICKDNILVYNSLARSNYPVTGRDFVNRMEYQLAGELVENIELTQILIFKESFYNIDEPRITKKTKRLTKGTIRDISFEVFGDSEYYQYYPSYMIDYIFSIFRGGGLIDEEEEGIFNFNLRSQHIFSVSPYTALANIMTLLIDESVMEEFFRNKDLNYKDLKYEIWSHLKNGEFEKLKTNKWKKRIGEIFESFGLLKSENNEYSLTEIGQLYTKYVAVDNLSQKNSSKILQIFGEKA